MYCLNLSLPPPFFFPHSILPFTLPRPLPRSLSLSLFLSSVFKVFFVCTACHHGRTCCFALFVCLTLLASFFLPSHLSFKNMYIYVVYTYSMCLQIQNSLLDYLLPLWHSCPSILSIFWCGLEYVHNSVLHTARACNYGKHYQCSVIRFPRTWSVWCTHNCTLLHITYTHPHTLTQSLTHSLSPPPPPTTITIILF